MGTIFSPKSQKELDAMDPQLRKMFFRHIDKVVAGPNQRRMRFGLPCYTEEVTRQARLVYNNDDGNFFIVRCFAAHKEYEKWYKSYK